MYLYLIIAIFILIAFLAFIDDEDSIVMKFALAAILLIMTCEAAFRPADMDKDYMAYLEMYYSPGSEVAEMVEPSYQFICNIAQALGSPIFIFVIYAFLTIPLKGYAISRLTPFTFMSVLVWYSHHFCLQDMTQIRVALAIAIFLFSLKYLIEGDKKRYLIGSLTAVLFHFSALLFVFLVFFSNNKLSRVMRITLWIAPIAFYAFSFLHIDLLDFIPIEAFQQKKELYEQMRDSGNVSWNEELNIFNPVAFARLFMYYMVMWKYEIIREHAPNVTILLKMSCASICFYAAFAFLPILAGRTEELFACSDFILVPYLIYTVKPQWVGRSLVFMYCASMMFFTLARAQYFTFT